MGVCRPDVRRCRRGYDRAGANPYCSNSFDVQVTLVVVHILISCALIYRRRFRRRSVRGPCRRRQRRLELSGGKPIDPGDGRTLKHDIRNRRRTIVCRPDLSLSCLICSRRSQTGHRPLSLRIVVTLFSYGLADPQQS